MRGTNSKGGKDADGGQVRNPEQDAVLQVLLAEVDDPDLRRRIALDHLGKYLRRAELLQRALDEPLAPPPGTSLKLIADDAEPTAAISPSTGRRAGSTYASTPRATGPSRGPARCWMNGWAAPGRRDSRPPSTGTGCTSCSPITWA